MKDRRLWCDGIDPTEYCLNGEPPLIRARALICEERRVEEWELRLIMPRPVASREAIDWDELLPAADVTRWMSFNKEERWIEIEPGGGGAG